MENLSNDEDKMSFNNGENNQDQHQTKDKPSFWAPDDPSTIWNGMENLVLYLSELHEDQVTINTMYVENMGGRVTTDLMEATHFVTDVIGTQEYYEAVYNRIRIMRVEWITRCYNACKKGSQVKATEEPFSLYESPPLYNLIIHVAKVSDDDHYELKKMLEDNGGIHLDNLTPEADLIVLGNEKLEDRECRKIAKVLVLSKNMLAVNTQYLVDSCNLDHPIPLNLEDSEDYLIDTEELIKRGLTKPKRIFKGLKIYAAGFVHAKQEKIKYDIVRRGGTWTDKNVDYLVLPVSGIGDFDAKQKVNEIWIEHCKTTNIVLPVSYYHKPIMMEIYAQPLTNCVITVGGFREMERKFLVLLAEQLGAWCQKTMAIRTTNDLKQTTHFICSQYAQDDAKIFANEHRIKAVNKYWLLHCAKSMIIMPFSERYAMLCDTPMDLGNSSNE